MTQPLTPYNLVIVATIIDTILILSTGDHTAVAPIVNSMLLFAYCGNPSQKYPVCSTSTVTTAFTTALYCNVQFHSLSTQYSKCLG
mmetsp:Transcript_52109/g.53103  ORF Transcript_52109/g.53103 Transcript_52109/m.53103 type:complete len:86 (-) Transcript_52109:351-608(-)